MPSLFFDDALPQLVRTLLPLIGKDALQKGVILRDASGRLGFFLARSAASEEERHGLEQALTRALGAYARAHRPIAFADEPGAAGILESDERIPVQVEEDVFCQLIDRRIVGSGWLAAPVSQSTCPPRIVFATLKGGVGRSTALAICAADLARRGRNVLVVDLDLEAPGLGDLMLASEGQPDYGVIDFLVENGLGGVDAARLPEFIGSSRLTTADGGRVDVMPALGRRSHAHPDNVLAKLSRAMIEDVTDEGSVPVAEQISSMIERMVRAGGPYDAVLVDSRAGMSELAAPAMIGIGATVLLFGTAQKQTIEGYRPLFAALQLLAQRDRARGRGAEWRMALRPVYAKASLDQTVEERFREELYELYSEHLYDAEDLALPIDASGDDPLRFAQDDNTAPHWPLMIPFNSGFLDFDPSRRPGQLSATFYEATFRPFLDAVDALIVASPDTPAA